MTEYGVVSIGNGYLSIPGLILILAIEIIILFLSYGYSYEYPKQYKVPVFLLMFCSISTLFIFMLSFMGWWIYAT
jgi:membrane-associated HD superfamily phosphohydrolase